jgi:hypothetical protein
MVMAQTPTGDFLTGQLSQRGQRRSVTPYNTFRSKRRQRCGARAVKLPHLPVGDREPLVATPPSVSLVILAGHQFVDCPPNKLGHRRIATNDQRGYPRFGYCIEAVG